AAHAQDLGGRAQPMVGCVEEDVALKGARRFAMEAKLWQGCFKGLWVADAELDLDLNGLHGRSLYRLRECRRSTESYAESSIVRSCCLRWIARLREEKHVPIHLKKK